MHLEVRPIILIPLMAALFVQSHRPPRFEEFPAQAVSVSRPARVDLTSDRLAPMFRTVLREGAAKGPNFAGHYTVVIWGCGSDCQRFAIIDALTGRTRVLPFEIGREAEYRIDSRLIIVDPVEPGDSVEFWEHPEVRYFEWTGQHLIARAVIKAPQRSRPKP